MSAESGLNLEFALLDFEEPQEAMPTTEFATFPLKPGTDYLNVGSEASRVMRDTLVTMYEQDGCLSVHSGQQVGSEEVVHLCVLWDCIESHEDFMNSPGYGDFARKFLPYISGPGIINHADVEPVEQMTKALSANITSITTCYYEGDPPEESQEAFRDWLESAQQANIPGFVAAAAGLTHEELEINGFHGRGMVIVTGWQSEEAYLAYRQTPFFKESVSRLQGKAAKVDMRQVKLQKLVA